jgi:hypothetical protein
MTTTAETTVRKIGVSNRTLRVLAEHALGLEPEDPVRDEVGMLIRRYSIAERQAELAAQAAAEAAKQEPAAA